MPTEHRKSANEGLALLIERTRADRDMSQEALAEAIGASRTQVWRWESARARPSAEHLLLLQMVLDISGAEMRAVLVYQDGAAA